jgi:hypothetical protein
MEFKSNKKIHKIEMTAHYWAGIQPTAVTLADRRPAWLGLAAAQMVGTGPCQ